MDLALASKADALWHEEHTATSDGDDHTFNGVMFNVTCTAEEVPVDTIYLRSVSVRGDLGEISVYAKDGLYEFCHETPEAWSRVYCAHHEPSHRRLVQLPFDVPVAVPAHGTAALYIHSTKMWDGDGMGAIVYNNQRSQVTIERPVMAVSPAMAHTACEPFSRRGFWGSAWRPRREFVGAIGYAVRWKLWTPENHPLFSARFRAAVRTMLLVHRFGSGGVAQLSQDMLFYVLNFLRHDAFADPAPAHLRAGAAAGRRRERLVTDRFGSTVMLDSDDDGRRADAWSFRSEEEESEGSESEMEEMEGGIP